LLQQWAPLDIVASYDGFPGQVGRRAHTLLAAYPQEPSLAGTVRGAVRVRGAGWRAEHTHRRG
jgi:hypothetical protein